MENLQDSMFSMPVNIELVKNQLKPLCYHNHKSERSYQMFFKLYYYIRLLKYATQKQLRAINFSGSSKVATAEILNQLVNIGHISIIRKDQPVYVANETTDKIIRLVKFNESFYFKVFASLPKGTETSNEVKNTDVFVQAVNLPNYHFLLFPDFTYLRPDGLLILKEPKRYCLRFLEIETPQANWQARFDRMRDNYRKLATDIAVYEYWKSVAGSLQLPVPQIIDFKFSVLIISQIKKNWGSGFEFKEYL